MVKVIAHRGFAGLFPENTILAFQKAMDIGVDVIEFDVEITKDSQLVLLHDSTVDRTTNGSGSVGNMTLQEVQALDAGAWRSPAYAGIHIPTFAEALALIPQSMELNIHPKRDARITRQIVSTLVTESRIKTAYISIDASQIPLAREICPEIRLCNMTNQGKPDYLETTIKLGCPILTFPHGDVTKELVQKAHSYGIEVSVFYANEESEVHRLMSYGVDTIVSDFPDIAMAARKSYR